MHTTRQWEDNRALVAECTLASLLQQLHPWRGLSELRGVLCPPNCLDLGREGNFPREEEALLVRQRN